MHADPGAARRRRTAGLSAIVLATALSSSACAAGRIVGTQNQRPAVSGVNASVGQIAIRNLTVEAPQAASYPAGSTLRLVAVLVNNGTAGDTLTDISSPSFTGWGAYNSIVSGNQSAATTGAGQANQTVPVAANSRTSFGVPDATGSLLALSTTSTIHPGSNITMTLTFTRAGTVTVRVPVNITSGPTQSVVPAPSDTASEAGGA